MSDSKALVKQVCDTLTQPEFRQKLSQALPPDVDLDRFSRTALMAVQTTPGLVDADRQSLYNSVVRAAQDGLLPDGREGALVIFSTKQGNDWIKKVQWMPMVYGVIQKLGKAGIHAYAASVYEGEAPELWNDEQGQHIKHVRNPFAPKRGELIGVYAVATTPDGRSYVEAMNVEDIGAIRERSKAKDSGPWKTDFERMAQKSALHRVSKRVSIADQKNRDAVARVIDRDAELYETETPAADEAPPPVQTIRTKTADKILGKPKTPTREEYEAAGGGAPIDVNKESGGGDEHGPAEGTKPSADDGTFF